MNEKLLQTLQSITPIPSKEIEKFMEIGQVKKIAQNDYFLHEGQTPRKIGLVLQGLFRYVYINREGKEFTRGFWPELSFVASYSAMTQRVPSPFFIQALENSEILEVDYDNWLRLKEGHPCWDKMLIAILERKFYLKEKRERELLLLEAKDRYLAFLEEFSEIQHRLRQHMIASYLGITPESLSRTRKKMGDLS